VTAAYALARFVVAAAVVATTAACAPAAAVDAGAVDDVDAGAPVVDAGPDSEAPCAFNRECRDAEHCECDEVDGCACRVGPRGTGQNGVDACVDGNDCASSVCVEDAEGGFTCSGECADEGDCAPKLPICADVAFVGRICIREP